MRETIDRMWTQFREWFATVPRIRKIQLSILSIVVIALAIVTVTLLTRTEWVAIPNTGDPTSTAAIYAALTEMGEQTRTDGVSIMVPSDRLGIVQMRLREQGFLGLTNFNRDNLADASGFGVTDRHAGVIYDNQLGDDIRSLIMQIPRIQSAMVLVTSGETSPFRIQTNARAATASVVLTLRGGGRLTQAEAQTVGEIVRTGIPGIEYENISITDSDMNLYRVGDDIQDYETELDYRVALRSRLSMELRTQVEQLLSPIFGMSNLQVQPHVKLNFDNVAIEQIEFAPPVAGEMDGIVRSSEEILENSRRLEDAAGVPGTDSNAMGTAEYPYGTLEDGYEYARRVYSQNMEINQTTTLIQREQGYIEELSIAVVLNSGTEGLEGEDLSEGVADLVAKAIGAPADSVSVQYMPFTSRDTTVQDMLTAMEEQEAAARNRALLETILMYVVILLLGVVVVLLVRTIVLAVKPPPEPEPELLMATGPELDFLIDDEGVAEREYEDVNLNKKSAGLEQIERFIDRDSASVAQLLRNWLTDEE